MKSLTLKAAVLAALSLTAVQASAAGFVTLPTSGTTPYVQCRVSGNFGSQSDTTVPPTTDSACAATPGVGATLNLNTTPESGFTLATSNTSSVTAFAETLATLNERVFKNGATPTACIYAKQLVMSSTTTHDYNPQFPPANPTAVQAMEVNDYAFGGYTGAVSAAYAKSGANNSSVYRIGRTFTSVQMQANPSSPGSPASGYVVLPTAGGTSGTEINGVGQTLTLPGSPSAAQQQAPFSANWVDFTSDVSGTADEDGAPNVGSSNMYIKQACSATTTTSVANSLKIRQTGQETQPWVIVTATSLAPSTTITP